MLMSSDVDGVVAEVIAASKIRNRCELSSSEPRRLRPKRGVRLIGRTGGGPSPCKASSSSSKSRRRMSESSSRNRHDHRRLAGGETGPTSARKLVSALWQLDGGAGACEEEGEVGWDARRSSDRHRRGASVELSRSSRRKSKALEGDGERSWHNGRAHGHWFSDVISNGGRMEARACSRGLASPCPGDRMAQLQELYDSVNASTELVRVLANVLAPGVLNPTAASLLVALRSELDVARARARQLVREQKRHGGDEQLQERLAEEVRAWKRRHREKAAAAARMAASELDAERRSRQRAERVGKKLGEALAEAEASLREARRELERERESRERLEKVCDELATGVGGAADEEQEELSREAEREELEREREMLQLADELREERVRLKLAEARLQFEEKNAVVDRLRQELEAFLGRDKEESASHDEHRHVSDDHRLQLALASISDINGIDLVSIHKNGEDGGGNDGDGKFGDDSDGSDIELNMDGNSRDYSWSYSTASKETPAKNAASSRSSRHGSFSDRGTEGTDGAGAGALERRSHGLAEAPEQHWNERCSDDDDDGRPSAKNVDEDAERYEAIKNLREQMLACHGFVFPSQQQQGEADADEDDDGDYHRRAAGFACQVEEGGLW